MYFLQIAIFERQQNTLYGVHFSNDLVREIEKQFSFFGESELSLRSLDELGSRLFFSLAICVLIAACDFARVRLRG